jgi:carbonic anhydrase
MNPLRRCHAVTGQNELMQVAYLKTHPAVTGAIARGQLTMSGWDYDIGAAEIRISDDGDALKGQVGSISFLQKLVME